MLKVNFMKNQVLPIKKFPSLDNFKFHCKVTSDGPGAAIILLLNKAIYLSIPRKTTLLHMGY